MMNWQRLLGFIIVACVAVSVSAKKIPHDKVLETSELSKYLKQEFKGKLKNDKDLAVYYREQFTKRFFYDYQNVNERFELYNQLYVNENGHRDRAQDHMGKYADSTIWKLPFNYLNGSPVNSYALRHLARQHKMMDIAYLYFYEDKDPKYIHYWHTQLRSLNTAFHTNKFESIEDGNGVYEAFRSGYRVLNWLSIHNLFLGEEAYTDKMQLQTIATLLQHGAHLYHTNAKFKSGNHQTRGMSALAMLAILFRDFEGTDQWYQHAMELLKAHMQKEINPDGFQFERSVHYHMSDIGNYFYVYQLVKNSEIEVDPLWEAQLKSLFTTLAKVAYPDKSAPVLQDDTDNPWAEKNAIASTMSLGYILFEDDEIAYFSEPEVSPKMYWFLRQSQLESLSHLNAKLPSYGSLSFPDTHYYIMREGWSTNDKMMIISAGLDEKKPDHQHGDMLGVQAMANGQCILPNYQVRYSLSDFELFKNSLVKNVALVDDELQGKKWTSNKGGSGFGKFKQLPQPTTIAWQSNTNFDLHIGSHDGFEDIGVEYSRQVIYVKDEFWIVKDNFQSDTEHSYKQVWQGHYSSENGSDLLRSSFSDASGCDIWQLIPTDSIKSSGSRGKQWNIVSKIDEKAFSFITVIYPYKGYSSRIDESDNYRLKDWERNSALLNAGGKQVQSLSKGSQHYLFNVQNLSIEDNSIQLSAIADIYLNKLADYWQVYLLSPEAVELEITSKGQVITKVLEPGDTYQIK